MNFKQNLYENQNENENENNDTISSVNNSNLLLPNYNIRPSSLLVPPLNFAMVGPGVYRSGHPNPKNYEFLRKLNLKSIMYLSADEYQSEQLQFNKQLGLKIFHFPIKGNKEPFGEINQTHIADALIQVLDRRNHPILIHCNKGKYRVGCLVGCLRKLQRWSLASIFDEFSRFANTTRIADQEFIEIFNKEVQFRVEYCPHWFLN